MIIQSIGALLTALRARYRTSDVLLIAGSDLETVRVTRNDIFPEIFPTGQEINNAVKKMKRECWERVCVCWCVLLPNPERTLTDVRSRGKIQSRVYGLLWVAELALSVSRRANVVPTPP